MGREELIEARKALADYRDKSICGYCREYAGTMIDTLDAMIEIDKNMEQIVAAKLNHPKMAAMPSLNKTMQGLKQKSDEMLNGVGAPSGSAGRRATPGGGFGLKGMAREMRNDIMFMVPRPASFLQSAKRRR
jgi:hypothetical protein